MPRNAGANTIGAFPVYNSQGTVNLFGQLMARKQAEDEAEKRQLAQHLSSLKTDGLREADRSDYYKLYDTWRSKEQEAYGQRDKQTKFNIQAEADKLYNQLNDLVSASKQAAAIDKEIGTKILANPYLFNKEGKVLAQKSFASPLSASTRINDYTKIPLGHDLSKVVSGLSAIDDQVMQTKSKYQNDIGTNDGKGTITYKRVRVGDPQTQALAYASAYDTDDGVKTFFMEKYPELDWQNNEAQAKAQAVQALVQERQLIREEAPLLRTDPDYINKAEAERLRLAREREARLRQKEANAAAAQDLQVIRKTFTGDKGKTSLEFDAYVPVNPIAFGTSQLKNAYNILSNKNEQLPGTGNIEITGIGYATRKGGKKQLTVSLVNSQGDEYAINVGDVPLKTRNDKVFQAALAKLESGKPAASTGATTAAPKKTIKGF